MKLSPFRHLLLKTLQLQFLLVVLLCASSFVLNGQNQAPIVNDGVFRVAENVTIEDIIARVDARDPDIGDVLTYSIIDGNITNIFSIDEDGLIRITQNRFFYTRSSNNFNISVQVTDQDGLSDTGNITLQIVEAQNDLEADLQINMTMLNNEAQTDEETDFIIVLENLGPDHMDFAEVEVKIPESDKDYEILSHTLTKGTYDIDDERWRLNDILPGDIDSLVVTVRIVDDSHEGHNHMLATVKIVNSGEADDNEDKNDESEAGLGHGPKQTDLKVTKTISNENANPGQFVTFTITAENLGPNKVKKVEVIDEIPTGYILVWDGASKGGYDPDKDEWKIGDMDAGDSEVLELLALVRGTGEYMNYAQIDFNDNKVIDVNLGNNIDSAGIGGIQEADIAITKSVNNNTPNIGDTITFTISASNGGPNNATNLTVEERLKSGYTYLSHTTSTGTYNTVTGHWEFAALNNGASESMTLTVTINEEGEYQNTAVLFGLDQIDPNDSNNSAEITLNPPISDLEIRKSFTPQFPNIGDNIIFTIDLANKGPSDNTGIEVEDFLNPLFTYLGSTATQGTYSPNTSLWNVGDLANGATAQLVIEVTMLPLPLPTESNTLNNIATITKFNAFDPNLDNNRAEVSIDLPTSDIALSKTVSESFPNVNEEIVFTVSAVNRGPSTATNITIEDKLPARYNYVRHEATLGTYSESSGIWDIDELNRNGQASIDFYVTVNANGDSVNRARVVNLDQFDPDASNDTARERVETKIIDLSVGKVVSKSTPNIGDDIVFSITLKLDSSANTTSANNISVLDQLPSGYEYINHTPSIGEYDEMTGIWTIESLSQNVEAKLDISAKVLSPEGKNYVNIASITKSDEHDYNNSNDADTATINIASLDIEVLKSVDNSSPNVGSNITFTINAKNLGESNATGLTISDPIKDGFLYVSSTPSIGNYDELTGLWTIGNLAKDSIARLDIAVKVAPFGEYNNTASLNSVDQHDTNSSNNESTVSVAPLLSDLSITKSVNNQNPSTGQNVDFTVTVSNLGPASVPNTNIIVGDQLPSGFTFVSYTTSDGSIYEPVSGLWLVDELAKDASVNLVITATVNASGDFTNIAQIVEADIFDPNQGNNTASASTVPQSADVEVIKTVDNQLPNVGDTITFNITVSNNGPNPASGVQVTDQLPSGYTYITHTTNSGTYDQITGVWDIGAVSSSSFAGKLSTVVLEIEAKVLSTGSYTNTATVTASDQNDPDPTNNTSSVTPTVQFADLAVNVVADKTEANPNEEIIIISTLLNQGPNSASNISSMVSIPDGLEFIEAFVSVGEFNSTSGIWTVNSLGSSSSAVLSVKVKMLNTGQTTVNTTINSADQFDPDTSNNTAQITINRKTADIAVTKTVDNPGANVGQRVEFTITVSNPAGPDNATGLTVLDRLPNGLSYIQHSTATGSYDPPSGLWDISNLNNGSTATLTITAEIEALAAFSEPQNVFYTNTASVSTLDQADPNQGNNSASVTVNPAYADLSLSMDVDIQNPNVGDQIDFTIRLLNNGPDASKGIVVTDLLPTGYTYVSHSNSKGTYTPANGQWEVGDLAFSNEEILTITALVRDNGDFTNIAEITEITTYDPNLGDNIAVISIVAQSADLKLDLTVDNNRPNIGGQAVFTVTVKNLGPDPATSVQVKDSLNLNGFVLLRSSTDFGSYIEENGTWELGGINVGQTATLQLTTEVLEGGPYDNKATITQSDQFDPDETNNEKTIFVTPREADLSVDMTLNKTSVVPNEEILIISNLRNLGPDATTGVEVTNRLPLGMEYITHNSTIGSYDNSTGLWSTDQLLNNESGSLIIRARILPNATYDVTATITASEVFDRDLTNNTVTRSVRIEEADISVQKSVNKPSANVNDNVEFTVIVSNNGPDVTSNLSILDQLQNGYEYIGSNVSKGSYSPATGIWTINDLANGGQATLAITGKVKAGGNHGNTASVNSLDQQDPNPTNNESSVNVEVPFVDLKIEKSIDNSNPNVGDNVTFTVTLTHFNSDENGSPATNIEVTDQLPNGYTLVSQNPSRGTYNPTSGIWALDTLVKNEAVTLTIVATVNASGDYTNIAAITKVDQYDPELGNNVASVSLVAQNADLEVKKSVSDPVPDYRDTVRFTISLTNLGPDLATGVSVEDEVPTGYAFLSSLSDFGSYDEVTGIWTIGSVNNESTATLFIDAIVNENGTFNNIASVESSQQFDPNTSNNSDTVEVTRKTADLKISQTVDKPNANLNEDVVFTVTLQNLGPFGAEQIVVNDLLPSGLTYQNHSVSRGAYNPTTGVWNVNDLANGSSVTLTLVGRVQSTGNYSNVATITSSRQLDPDLNNNSSSLEISINQADLSLTKVVNKPKAFVGEDVTFTITVQNASGPNNASGILVNDILPNAYIFKSSSTVSGTYDQSTGNWTLGNLAVGASATLDIVAEVKADGDYQNVATISSSDQLDPNINNNFDDASVDVFVADIGLTSTNSNPRPIVGENVIITLNTTNNGPDNATEVQVQYTIPDGLEFVSTSTTQGTLDDETRTWNIGSLATGVSAQLAVEVKINKTGSYVFRSQVSNVKEYDNNPNNDINLQVILPQTSELSLSKVVDKNTPNVNDTVQFNLTLGNNGFDQATNVEVTDLLKSGFDFISSDPSTGYNSTTGIWSVASLSSGDSTSLKIKAKVLSTGDYSNTASITKSDQFDPNSNNNSSSVTLYPQFADLSITKIVSNETPIPGETIDFTITATNQGPNQAIDVEVLDNLPNGYEFISSAATLGTYDPETHIWTVGNMSTGATQVLIIRAEVQAGGNFENVATISSKVTFDPVLSNNSASKGISLQTVDIGVTKIVDKANPKPSENITFTITVVNNGPNDATGLTITDEIPTGLSIVSLSASAGQYNPTTGDWFIGNLPNAANATLTIVCGIEDGISFTNVARLSGLDQFDNNVNNDTDQAVVTVQTSDIGITKNVDKPNENVGQDVIFTITATNAGPNNATELIVRDQIPSGYLFLQSSAGSNYDPASGNWRIGTLGVGKTATLTIDARVIPLGEKNNVASLLQLDQIDNNNTNDRDSAQVNSPIVDLSIAKVVDQQNVPEGTVVNFTVTLTNGAENTEAATNIEVEEILLSGYELQGNYTPSIGTFSNGIWSIPQLGPNSSGTLTFAAKVLATGDKITTSEIIKADQYDPNQSNNFASASVELSRANVNIRMTVNDITPNVGDTTTFTVYVSNIGPSPATNVLAQGNIPAGLNLVSVQTEDGTFDPATGDWTLASVQVGDTAQIEIKTSVLVGTEYKFTSQITSLDQVDDDPTDNMTSIEVNPQSADLQLGISSAISEANIGDIVGFNIALSNVNGPDAGTQVEVSADLPPGYIYQSHDDPTGTTFDPTTGTWDVSNINFGSSLTLTVEGRVISNENLNYLANIETAKQYDPDTTNNSAELAVIVRTADVQMNKSVNVVRPNIGDQIEFELKVTNNGPDTANNVLVFDELPSGYQPVEGSDGSNELSDNNWTIQQILPNADTAIVIPVIVLANGDYNNTAQIVSLNEYDPDLINNTSDANIFPQFSDLGLVASARDLTPNVGDTVKLSYTLENFGLDNATDVRVSNLFGSGIEVLSATPSTGTFDPNTGLWDIPIIDAFSIEIIDYFVKFNPSGVYEAITLIAAADQYDPNEDNNADKLVFNVQQADLALSLEVDQENTNIGDKVNALLELTNLGPNAATNASIIIDHPDGLRLDSYTAPVGTIYNEATKEWYVPFVLNGQNWIFEASYTVIEGTDYVLSSSILSADQQDPDQLNNSAEIDLFPQTTDVGLTLTVDDDNPIINQDVIFSLIINNENGPDRATGVVIDNIIPSGYQFVSASTQPGDSFNPATGLLTVRDLLPGTNSVFNLRLKVLISGDYDFKTEMIAINEIDINDTNNSATASVTLQTADLSITKNIDDDTPDIGQQVEFTTVIANNGPDNATNILSIDWLESGYEFLSASATLGSYDENTGYWVINELTNGDDATLTINARVEPFGKYDELAGVASFSQVDPNLDNNTSELSVVPVFADLSIDKRASTPTPNVGDTITFTINLGNIDANGANATGVQVEDVLQRGYEFVSEDSGGDYDPNTGLWTVGSINVGETKSLNIRAKVLERGPYRNLASITASDQYDPDPNNNASLIFVDAQQADLAVEKTVTNNTPAVGETVIFEITLDNLGLDLATDVVVNDKLSDGYKLLNADTDNGLYDSITGNWTIQIIDRNTIAKLLLTAEVLPNGSTYNNTASITASDQNDPNPSNNESTVIVIPEKADIEVTLSTSNISPIIGETVVFTLRARNNGGSDATNVVVNQAIPDGFELVQAFSTSGTFENGIWTIGDMANGAEYVLTSITKVKISGDHTVVAEVANSDQFDPDTSNNIDIVSIVLQSADLSVSKKVEEEKVEVGGTATFFMIVENQGPFDASNIVAYDKLPAGYQYKSHTVDKGTYSESSGLWVIPALANKDNAILTIVAEVTATQDYTNEIQIVRSDQIDPDQNDNSASAGVSPQFIDIALYKRVNRANPNIGDTVTFEVKAINLNKAASRGTGIQVYDQLPSGYNFISAQTTKGSYDTSSYTWSIAELISGEEQSLFLSGTVKAEGPYLNVAFISAQDQFDPNEDNNFSTASIETQSADLAITKTALQDSVDINSDATFEITLRNNGPNPATNVLIQDQLPNGLIYKSSSTDYGAYNSDTGIWSVGIIDTAATATLTLTATVIHNGLYENTASILNADQFDPDTENNSDTASIVPILSDLAVSMTVNNRRPIINESVVFTVNVSNIGPSRASGIELTNIIQSGFTFESYTSTAGTYDSATGIWNVGQLVANANATLNLVAKAKANGDHSNTAAISASDQWDPIISNNSATVNVFMQSADIVVAKDVDNATANVGQNVVFTITTTNNGPQDASGLSILDQLPSGYTYVSHTQSTGTYNNTTGLWDIGALANTASANITITATVKAAGDRTNSASVNASDQVDNNTANNSDSATVNPPVVDLALTKSVNNNMPNVGENVVFTLTVDNLVAGNDNATGVQVTDVIPSGYTYVSDNGNGAYVPGTGIWTIGALNSGTSSSLQITATVNASGNSTNVAIITAADQYDPVLGNNVDFAAPEALSADLAITKVVDNNSPNLNHDVVFTITLTNNGPDVASNVQVTDQLPSGYTFVSDDSNGKYNNTTGIWDVGNINNADSYILNITAKASNISGQFENTASISRADQNDPDTGNNSSSASVTVQQADLVVTKTVNNNAPIINEEVIFTVTAANVGPNNATNVTVLDQLPNGYQFSSATPSTGSYDQATGIWIIGNINNGGNAVLTLVAKVITGGTYLNTAAINTVDQYDPVASNNSDNASVSLQTADIAVAKDVDNATANVGQNVVFTITTTNNGPQDASGLSILDQLPSGYTYVSHTQSTGTYNNTTGLWDIGALANAASANLTITATVNASGDRTNSASVNASDQVDNNGSNDSDTSTVNPAIIDLSLTKTMEQSNPNVGDGVSFMIKVKHNGPSEEQATGIQILDRLPQGLGLINFTPSQGDFDRNTGVWNVGSLAFNTEASLELFVSVDEPGPKVNVALITQANEFDPNQGNNIALQPLVTQSADLAITKTVDNGTPQVGEDVDFTISVKNNGPDPATGVVVDDLLPSGFTYISSSTQFGSYDPSSGKWTGIQILNDSSASLIIRAEVLASGEFTNTATISAADQIDPDNSNNTSSVEAAPQISELSIVKTVDNATPNPGTVVNFEIRLTNNGPSAATNITAKDKIPDGFNLIGNTVSIGTYDSLSGNWTIPQLSNGTVALLVLRAEAIATGNHTNTASIVSSDQFDPNTDNNSSSISLNITTADLALSKSVNNENANVGEEVEFTIQVSNQGPDQATGIVISDPLPSGYTLRNSNVTAGTYNTQTGIWTLDALGNGNGESLTITARVNAENNYNNIARILRADQFDNNLVNNKDSASVNPPTVDLSISKSVNRQGPLAGDTVTFRILLTHNGPDPVNATNVTVTDPLPNGYTYITNRSSTGTYDNITGLWNVGTVETYQSDTLEIDAIVLATGNFTNIAIISNADQFDPNLGDNISFASVVPLSTDLLMSKTVDKENVVAGDTSTFTLEVRNLGPSPASNIQVRDLLPTELRFIDFSTQHGYIDSNNLWNIGSLNTDSTATLTFRTEVQQTNLDTISNIAEITRFDQIETNASNNIDTAIVVLQKADLTINKLVDDTEPVIGQTVVFSINTTNNGPVTATNIQVTDQLPSGYSLSSFVASSGTFDQNSGIWSISELTNGSSANLTLVTKVLATGEFLNTAEITGSDQLDPDLSNNKSSAGVTIKRADLALSKVVDKPEAVVGNNISFTITVSNNGPDQASNIEVEDKLPNAYAYVSSAPSSGTYNPENGIWSIPTLANSASTQLVINTILLPEKETTNTAKIIRSDQIDENSQNNSDSATVSISAADIWVIKTADKYSVSNFDTVNFEITVHNLGSDKSDSLVIKDQLPSGLTIIDGEISQGDYNLNSGLWTIRDFGASETALLTLVTTVNLDGEVSNTAQVAFSSEYDPDSSNNSSTAQVERLSTDIAVMKSVDILKPNVGDTINFTINVSNEGQNTATNIFIRDIIDQSFEPIDIDFNTGNIIAGESLWQIEELSPGASARGIITVIVKTLGSYSNRAELIYLDQVDDDPSNNSSTVILQPQILDLSIDVTVSDSVASIGQQVTFTSHLTNLGPDLATNITVSESIPDGYEYVSHTSSAGTFDINSEKWILDSLQKDTKAELNIVVKMLPSGSNIKVSIIEKQDQFDFNLFNNISGNRVLLAISDISVSKSINNTRPLIGDTVRFTIEAENLGQAIATNVSIFDRLPVGFSFVGNSGDGVFDSATGEWKIDTIQVNTKASLFLDARVLPQRGYLNVAFLASLDQSDPNDVNNVDFAGILPQISDLAISKTVSNIRPRIGEEIDFVVTLTNNGIDQATRIEVLDSLAPGFRFIEASVSEGSFDPQTGLWKLESLGITESANLTIRAEVVIASNDIDNDYINYAYVIKSDQFDPNERNNIASSFVVIERSDIAINKTVDNERPKSGEQVTFTITINNLGLYTARDVFVVDRLPSGYELVQSDATAGTFDEPGGIWIIGSLVPDEIQTLTLIANVNDQGEYTNVAEASTASLDPNLENNIDSAGLVLNNSPIARDNNFTMLQNTTTTGSVATNDTDGEEGDFAGTQTLTYSILSQGSAGENGVIDLDADGIFRYTPDPTFNGEVSFTYQVCDNGIPVECSQANVNISVTENLDVEVPNGFSPNNDGTGDTWIIEGIEVYPNNTVKIFNRWGNVVWEANGYNNQDVAWNGDATTGIFVNSNGEPLPDATYFYTIDLKNGAKPLSGFVVLKRTNR